MKKREEERQKNTQRLFFYCTSYFKNYHFSFELNKKFRPQDYHSIHHGVQLVRRSFFFLNPTRTLQEHSIRVYKILPSSFVSRNHFLRREREDEKNRVISIPRVFCFSFFVFSPLVSNVTRNFYINFHFAIIIIIIII